MRRKALGLGVMGGIVLAGGAGWALTGRDTASSASAPAVEASISSWRWAPDDQLPARRRESEPAAAAPQDTTTAEADATRAKDPKPTRPATAGRPDGLQELPASGPGSTANSGDDVLVKADVLKNGVALPPLESPPEVRAIFEAGNTIARSPYVWGGGHGKWLDKGYDCSGSVSYALAAAGLVNTSYTSGQFMRWGAPGKGKWITLYANDGHVWMVVAGVRFDTVARGQTGSRWINSMASTSGYVARHPPGF